MFLDWGDGNENPMAEKDQQSSRTKLESCAEARPCRTLQLSKDFGLDSKSNA